MESGLRADGLRLEGTDPNAYTHLLFVCGPAHGLQVRQLHERFAHCRRVAVGESRLWCPTILPSPDSMRSSRATGQVSVRTVIWRLAHAVRTRTRVAARGMPPVAPSLRCCSNPLRKSDLERLLLRLRDPCAVARDMHPASESDGYQPIRSEADVEALAPWVGHMPRPSAGHLP